MVAMKCVQCGHELERDAFAANEEIACPNCGEKIKLLTSDPNAPTEEAQALVIPPAQTRFDQANTPNPGQKNAITHVDPAQPQTISYAAFPFLKPTTEPNILGWLAHYRVIRVVGQGGMGVVFEAFDTHLDRTVAIKAMTQAPGDDPGTQERFFREARAMASVRSDHIVGIYQVGTVNGVPYLAMEFLQGESLDVWHRKNGPSSLADVVRISLEIARGLQSAHQNGLIHRDIKPSNIWIESPTGRVKILDFGLARSSKISAYVTQPGLVLGTPAYMSPEQAEGQPVDGKSDLYSLGCVIYELVTGEIPFTGETPLALLMTAKTKAPVPPQKRNSQVPPSFNELILALLAKRREDRPSTGEVISWLESIAGDMGIPVHGAAGAKIRITGRSSWFSRRKVLLGSIGVVGAAALGLVGRRLFFAGNREIVLGMSGPFSGTSRELGRGVQMGIETYLKHVNDQGGINGRKFKLEALDDGYEPEKALENMKELHEQRHVFAAIGNVGTPSAAKTVPYAVENKMLFFGGFTGAKLLREDPPVRYVFNYRASYREETATIVNYLLDHYRLRPDKIAVFDQDDAFGDDGFQGVAATLQKFGRDPKEIVRGRYERNTTRVDEAVKKILAHQEIKAVVMVATYKPAAEFIKKVKDSGRDIIFSNVSFVGTEALMEELKEDRGGYADGVIVTQVVPPINSGATLVINYRELFKKYNPQERPTFVSLEGYIDAVILLEGIRRAGANPTAEKVIDALETIDKLDVGTGSPITFGPSEHQASHKVWATKLTKSGQFEVLNLNE
jgi:ABC-type branched-subunit amino acid transport system substrate-binding protein/DNA-directed RNA polymerase subunit RPC12/RpoP